MAGFLEHITVTQKPKVNSYVKSLLDLAESAYGLNSNEYRGIYNQYFKMPQSDDSQYTNRRHYEAEVHGEGVPKGLERLYKKVVVIDLLTSCAAECVYCLRGYYDRFALLDSDMKAIAQYCGEDKYLTEVLITGGDPLLATKKLRSLLLYMAEHSPNIKKIRIGSRVPVQDPQRIGADLIGLFESLRGRFDIEIACQINHPFELQMETLESIEKLKKVGCRLYSQNVLLKDVNDHQDILIELYEKLRELSIESHYLFHAVPMLGTNEFRTTVQKGIDLINMITACGKISGRAKPMYALMTDVGKVVLYHDSIISKSGNLLKIKTNYSLADRLLWNKYYSLPDSAELDENGLILVNYMDVDE